MQSNNIWITSHCIRFFVRMCTLHFLKKPAMPPIKVYKLAGGEIFVWHDDSCICIKADNKYNDPVELADDDALELSALLSQMVRDKHNR